MGPRPSPEFDSAKVSSALAEVWDRLTRAGVPKSMIEKLEKLERDCKKFFDGRKV